MKKVQLFSVVLTIVLLSGFHFGVCQAQNEEPAITEIAPVSVSFAGKVSVVKSDVGELISINLLVTESEIETEYRIVLDEKGKMLAEMNDMTVNVTGTVSDVNGLKWFTVTECKKSE